MIALIVDDEPKARSLLQAILQEHCPQLQAIHQAGELTAAVQQIRATQPDVVFMDIEMPGYLGTQIGELLEPHEMSFGLVFTTAYSEYAIKAFEMNAVDYLLKPLRPQKVAEVVERIEAESRQNQLGERLEQLRKSLESHSFKKIGLPVSDGILFLPFDELIHLQAEGMYTKVFTNSHGEKLVSKPLRYFADLLGSNDLFYRPHRSHLVNLKYLQQYVRKDGNYILLENNQSVPISKEKRDEFLALVNLL